ncbi:hypothetical protein FSARC_5515 [Fusarium sarcochroum]|uniref:DUF4536 domain-containing protein n=1 Tax=Fusarium sarcochroum TaxID=1208366 RepID=A0A8H4X9E9_9HYPO|nr:hypothetical protein FSARC_5515 [Fusarium sarcochroum]
MSGDKTPTLQSLEKPEKLENILRQDRGDDCLPCKVVGQFFAIGPHASTSRSSEWTNTAIGSGAFFGLGAYSYFSGMSQLDKQKDLILRSKSPFGMRSRKFGITGISLALVWMGLWRALK